MENDELNQVNQEEEEVVFDDTENVSEEINEESEVVEDTTEPTDEVEKEVESKETKPTNNEFLKIKYNKEEKALTQEEAIEYAQKGMNYDHVKEELEKVKSSKALSVMEKYAKQNNMTVEQYADYLDRVQEEERIKEYANENGVSEELAKEIYELKRKDKEREEALEKQKQKEQIEQVNKECFMKLADYFKTEYGREINPKEDVPNRVFEIQDEYQVPVHIAFKLYENEKLKTELKIKTQNQKNAESSVGSVTNSGVVTEEIFSQERINKMSPQEMAKYWDNPKFRKAIGVE